MPTAPTFYVSLYFACSIALFQGLHCYYVANDPSYKGELGLGWPWFHRGIVHLNESVTLLHNYSFQSTLTLFVGGFVVALAVLNPLLSGHDYVPSSLVLPILALVSVGAFAQVMGPGGYKGFLALFVVCQVAVVCHAVFRGLPSWYPGFAAAVAIPVALGWTQLMHSRLKKYEQRRSVFTMGLYGVGSVIISGSAWGLLCLAVL